MRRFFLGLFLAAGCGVEVSAERIPLVVTENSGVARRGEIVTSGVPFPPGALPANTPVRLLDEQGKLVPLQSQTTATWRDGSVKWLLLDFLADVEPNGSRNFTLLTG